MSLKPRPENTIRGAVEDSLPLLQRADVGFTAKAGCISCHDNVRVNVQALEKSRDQLHQGFNVPAGDNFGDFIIGYMLLGLHAENYRPDLNTDTAALCILSRQNLTGEWAYPRADLRPPICLNYITQTAIAMRALQFYAPARNRAAADKAIRLAAAWLANAKPANSEDRSWCLLGLAWAGSDKTATQMAARELLEAQRPDGGWSELPTMESSAFATGESLVALRTAGEPVYDPAFQPAFDAGFPHGVDQWISDAGTSWAAMALPETAVVADARTF